MTKRAALRMLVAIIVLLGGLAGIAYAIFWYLAMAALPQTTGTLALPGLNNPVTITRDRLGVPHIQAANLQDLLFAQGYVMAQDRLWQMDLSRRVAAGELAEIFGERALERDKESRTYLYRHVAQKALRELPMGAALSLEQFSAGVNAFIASHHDRLPIEFIFLRYQPRPWTPADTFLVVCNMFEALTSSWQSELAREKLTARIGPELARDLYVVDSRLDHPAGEGPVVARPARKARPAGARRSWAAPYELWQSVTDFQVGLSEALNGSNNWVISGARTYSGKPLLANDTHLELTVPDTWYLVHLKSPELNVRGFALPGIPWVVLGHNEHIAWGVTNVGADVQDLFVEEFDPERPDYYRTAPRGGWKQATRYRELIKVKGKPDVSFDVLATHHGPGIRKDGNRMLALRWTLYDPGALSNHLLSINQAANWQQFLEALRDWTSPSQNFVYADDQGNIGYHAAGRIPLRRSGDGAMPVSASTDAGEWIGTIPFDELPQAFNPPGGVIATANARITPAGYPFYVTDRWEAPYRTARIYDQINQLDKRAAPEDLLALQTDSFSYFHRWFADQLVAAAKVHPPTDARIQQAIQALDGWDGRATLDSIAPTLTDQARRRFLTKLLEAKAGADWPEYRWFRSPVFVENVLHKRPARWLPPGFKDYDQLLLESLKEAFWSIEQQTRSTELKSWQWGPFNRLRRQHPLVLLPIIGRVFRAPAGSQAGMGYSVRATGPMFGPAMRFVADLSNLDRSLLNLTVGESGQIYSPHYADQYSGWAQGLPQRWPFSNPSLERETTRRLQLLPAAR